MRLSLLLSFINLFVTLGKTERSIVFTQWIGTGTKNVKYETMANNIIDNNGNIIPQKSNARKNINGRMIYDCIDIMGKIRQDGEEYERRNSKFKYKCNNGTEIIIENACNVDGKLYHAGDEIRSEFFLMKCGENGYEIIGCYYIDKNKMKIDMKPGTTVEVDGTVHYCDDKNDNIQYYKKRTGCMKYGNKYKEGEKFAKNHLRYECKNGIVDIIGCYVDETGRNIEIGDSITDKNMLYSCYVENGQIKYEQFPCGLTGFPSCEVSQKQQKPIRVGTISKPDSGFEAFSIAQLGQFVNRRGNKMVESSNAIKLN